MMLVLLTAALASVLLFGGCAMSSSPAPAAPSGTLVAPSSPPPSRNGTAPVPSSSRPESAATASASAGPDPSRTIDHPTGQTDIVLRFDNLPDHGLGELDGESFRPGPEFTLYGDGTVIFRDELAAPYPIDGAIVRARPFWIGKLDEPQIQSVLRYALDEAGLRAAPERYDERTDTDDPAHTIFIIRAGGIDKRVEAIGSNHPYGELAERLRHIDEWVEFPPVTWPGREFHAVLVEADLWIELGVLPRPSTDQIVAWPWAHIAPDDFNGLGQYAGGRRNLSAAEATVLDLSDGGGVVRRLYLLGPDKTLYSFSLWPLVPAETT
jgi:hypothetical protein